MIGALVYKEFRETIGIAALGLAALMMVVAGGAGFSPLPTGLFGYVRGGSIPFVSDTFLSQFTFVAAGLAIALGLRQSIGDFLGDAQLFLLHRPVDRSKIYVTKLTVGLATYLVCGLVAIAAFAGWAALPGTHASPFEWSMTAGAWSAWLVLTAVYLGALLTGLRPGAWFGTRLAPLGAAVAIALLISLCRLPLVALLVVVVDLLLISMILSVAHARNFA